ncbi:MAG TPA: glycogen/starch synthase [Anaerolineales bacterium]|nr:glycogen/starch synthase [Anaerolineales bacterium]
MVLPLKVLFLCAEATPLAKVGGLGDVGGELPRALRQLGLDVRSSLPRYPSIDLAARTTRAQTNVEILRRGESLGAVVYRQRIRGTDVLLVDGEPVARDRQVYGGGKEEGEKFVFWSLAALAACQQTGWRPDVVHAHDWHSAAAVSWLAAYRAEDPFWRTTAAVFTIHNLAYAGAGHEEAWHAYGLPDASRRALPDWARSLPLVGALTDADWLTTVSPSYASEITTPDFGFGLDPMLVERRASLTGILNGIDLSLWNPATDRALKARFTAETLERRGRNKLGMQNELGFASDGAVPLLAFIGRLEHQKGIDLMLQSLAMLLDLPWQAVVLGTGQVELEEMATSFEQGHTGRFRFRRSYDPDLARRIYGSADMVIVPSRYEPCGLVQMIGMRYGCIPVVRATGGLRDTVRDHALGSGTGFVFAEPSPMALAEALRRAMRLFGEPRGWAQLQHRAARRDFGWDRPARKYAAVYRRAMRARGARR